MSRGNSRRRRARRKATELVRNKGSANGKRATGKPAGAGTQKERATGGKQTRFRLRWPHPRRPSLPAVAIALAVLSLLVGGSVFNVVPWFEKLWRSAPPPLALSNFALAMTDSGRGNITFEVTNRSNQPQIISTVAWIPHGVPNPPVTDDRQDISLNSYHLQPGESTAGSIRFSRTGLIELQQTETSDVLVYVTDMRPRESGAADVGLTWGQVTSVAKANVSATLLSLVHTICTSGAPGETLAPGMVQWWAVVRGDQLDLTIGYGGREPALGGGSTNVPAVAC